MPEDRIVFADILENGASGITAMIEGTKYGPGVISLDPTIQAGASEAVGFLLPQSSRQPVILAQNPRLREFPPDFFKIRGGSGGVVIPLKSGLWVQTGGFWWLPFAGLFAQLALAINTDITTATETFTGPPATESSGNTHTPHIIFQGAGRLYMYLLGLPPVYYNLTVTDVQIDGVSYAAYYGPHLLQSSLPTVSLQDTPDIRPGTPTPPVGPSPGATFGEIKITYTFYSPGAKQYLADAYGTGPDTAISLRGLCMVPDPASDHQLLAVLQQVYASDGGDMLPTDQTDGIDYTAGQLGLELSHQPASLDPGKFAVTYLDASDDWIDNATWVDYVVGQTLYALGQLMVHGPWSSPGVNVDYRYADGDRLDHEDDYAGDGATNVYPLTCDVRPTTTLEHVDVNGVTDELATLDAAANTVTLSFAPDDGAGIEIYYYQYNEVSTNDFFEAGDYNGASVFTLTHPPIPGTVTVSGLNVWLFSDPSPPTIVLVPLIDGSNVRFACKRPSDGHATVTYGYLSAHGQLFHATGCKITEFDLNAPGSKVYQLPLPAPYDATPVSQFLPLLSQTDSDGSTRWKRGWEGQWWAGYLWYDPLTDTYTAATPAGLYWRKRTTGNVSGTDWTRMDWPDPGFSQDPALAGWDYPAGDWGAAGSVVRIADLPRVTAPWLGVSIVAQFGLIASWGPISLGPAGVRLAPESAGGGVGVQGDTDFQISFLKRDSSGGWGVVAQKSVKELAPALASSAAPLYIPSSGLVHREAFGGYANSRQEFGLRPQRATIWPATRNVDAWLIGCGWARFTPNKDLGPDTRAAFHTRPLGLDDTGYTLSAWAPDGTLLDQLTFRPSLLDIVLGWNPGDLTRQVDSLILHCDDEFSINPDPSLFPVGRTFYFGISTLYVATKDYGSLDSSGNRFFYYSMSSVDGDPKIPLMQMAGIPTLACSEPRLANSTYGLVGAEANPTDQALTLDQDSSGYLVLCMPMRVRDMNTVAYNEITEPVTGTNTLAGPFTGSANTNHYVAFLCPGYNGGTIITGVRDSHLDVSWTSSQPPPDHPSMTGTACACVIQGGNIGPGATTTYAQVTFTPPDHQVPRYDSFGVQVDTDYTWDGPLVVPWYETIPSRTYCTLRSTHGLLDSDTAYYLKAGSDERPPYIGAAIFDYVGDHRRVYRNSVRTYLIKTAWTASTKTLREVGRIDISHQETLPGMAPVTIDGSTYTPSANVPVYRKVHAWRPAGRYIFLPRNLGVVLSSGSFGRVDYLTLEVWDQFDGTTGTLPTSPRYLLYLPGGATAPANPLQDSDYKGAPQDVELLVGVDHSGREWATISCTVTVDGDSHHQYKFKCVCPKDQTQPVAYSFSDQRIQDFPTPGNVRGVAAAADEFAWMGDGGGIYVKSGG